MSRLEFLLSSAFEGFFTIIDKCTSVMPHMH